MRECRGGNVLRVIREMYVRECSGDAGGNVWRERL